MHNIIYHYLQIYLFIHVNILIPGIRQGIHSAGICWELTLSQPATIFTKNPHLAKQPAAGPLGKLCLTVPVL